MRTMFAVGRQNRTHTRIIIRGRLRENRREGAERGSSPARPRALPRCGGADRARRDLAGRSMAPPRSSGT